MRRIRILVALAACLMFTLPAFGDTTTIDFGNAGGVGGLFTLNGAHGSGANIPIAVVTIVGAPTLTSNGKFSVQNGRLDFDTALNFITITGSIADLGITEQELLRGSFTSFSASRNGLVGGEGPDQKARDLLLAVGLPVATKFSHFGFALTTAPIPSGENSASVISTDIRNTSVPEAGSIGILLTFLLGCAGPVAYLRRRA